jgi:hypothetical protein
MNGTKEIKSSAYLQTSHSNLVREFFDFVLHYDSTIEELQNDS